MKYIIYNKDYWYKAIDIAYALQFNNPQQAIHDFVSLNNITNTDYINKNGIKELMRQLENTTIAEQMEKELFFKIQPKEQMDSQNFPNDMTQVFCIYKHHTKNEYIFVLDQKQNLNTTTEHLKNNYCLLYERPERPELPDGINVLHVLKNRLRESGNSNWYASDNSLEFPIECKINILELVECILDNRDRMLNKFKAIKYREK